MTPEEIRAKAVETLARAIYEHRAQKRSSDPSWDDASEARREMYLWQAERCADALAEAGLLPTEVEHGVIVAGEGDDPADWSIAFGGPPSESWGVGNQIQRYVGPWAKSPEVTP